MSGAERFDLDGCDDAYRLTLGRATAFVVIHRAVQGRAFGGIRVRPYPTDAAAVEDAFLLARAMSRKVILADLPAGGAKTVVRVPHGWTAEERRAEMTRLGAFVESLGGRYFCGADLGFSDEDEAAVASATRHLACRALGPWTSRSTLLAMRAVCEPESAAIQGVGAVGRDVAEDLIRSGATVTVADVVDAAARSVAGAAVVAPESIYDVPCEVWSPCAAGGVIDAGTVELLDCRVVCGGANNPFAGDETADRLHARGILYVPDVLSNAGAVIKGASDALGQPERVESRLAAIAGKVRDVLRRSADEDRSPHRVAADLADELLARAS